MRWRWWALTAAILGGFAGIVGYLLLPTARSEAPNRYCPVMPEREADDGHDVQYNGRRVRLCCDSCVAAFRAAPEIHARRLPSQYHDADLLSLPDLPTFDQLLRFCEQHRPATTVIVAALVMFFASRRFAGDGSKLRRSLRVFGRPVMIPLALQTVVIVELMWGPRPGRGAFSDETNWKVQFGFQHDMLRQAVREAEAGIAPRLSAVYYRGNDERNPAMFNGGDYRTATFRVGLTDEAGNEMRHGDSVAGRKLFVRLEIIRGPFTSDSLFVPEAMRRVGLIGGDVSQFGEIGGVKPVVLTETVPGARWEGRYLIAEFLESPPREHQAVVYLSPVAESIPAAHYGIQCRLRIKDGKLEADSRLWMGAVFFTDRELAGWFSHNPIPELPGPNTTDPVLLGITNPDGSPKAKVK